MTKMFVRAAILYVRERTHECYQIIPHVLYGTVVRYSTSAVRCTARCCAVQRTTAQYTTMHLFLALNFMASTIRFDYHESSSADISRILEKCCGWGGVIPRISPMANVVKITTYRPRYHRLGVTCTLKFCMTKKKLDLRQHICSEHW
jgi:hypothetical protein